MTTTYYGKVSIINHAEGDAAAANEDRFNCEAQILGEDCAATATGLYGHPDHKDWFEFLCDDCAHSREELHFIAPVSTVRRAD